MKRAWRLLLSLTAALSLWPGCATTAEVAKLRAELSELRAKQRQDAARLTDEITIAKHFTEFSLRQLSSRVECDNSRVREFLKSCEEGAEACSEQGLANALSFMDTQPYVMLFMRPGVGIQGISVYLSAVPDGLPNRAGCCLKKMRSSSAKGIFAAQVVIGRGI